MELTAAAPYTYTFLCLILRDNFTDIVRSWTHLSHAAPSNTKFSAHAVILAFSDSGAHMHYYFCNCLTHEGEGGRFLRNVANQRPSYLPLSAKKHKTRILKYHLLRRFKSARMSRSVGQWSTLTFRIYPPKRRQVIYHQHFITTKNICNLQRNSRVIYNR